MNFLEAAGPQFFCGDPVCDDEAEANGMLWLDRRRTIEHLPSFAVVVVSIVPNTGNVVAVDDISNFAWQAE
jgi:hypothetical protein